MAWVNVVIWIFVLVIAIVGVIQVLSSNRKRRQARKDRLAREEEERRVQERAESLRTDLEYMHLTPDYMRTLNAITVLPPGEVRDVLRQEWQRRFDAWIPRILSEIIADIRGSLAYHVLLEEEANALRFLERHGCLMQPGVLEDAEKQIRSTLVKMRISFARRAMTTLESGELDNDQQMAACRDELLHAYTWLEQVPGALDNKPKLNDYVALLRKEMAATA